jgi:CBS domain containing-hemolysin-like protein
MSHAQRIGAVLLLVLGNAIFVAAEYALVTARRHRLEERAEHGGRSARIALRLMDEPVRLISTVQIAITVFGIALGGIGEPLVGRYLLFDALDAAFREVRLRRDPKCPACGEHPTITEYIDYEGFCASPSEWREQQPSMRSPRTA